ncbi:MAG: nitroreductase family protein, partial [Desulfobacteraceae bacterium]|nr:nitroreductase family protein [Desulfobacteraceae bacterium]
MSEDLLQMRRSVRSFRSTSVPQPLLEEILGQAALAPSWANTQCWRFVLFISDSDACNAALRHGRLPLVPLFLKPEIVHE